MSKVNLSLNLAELRLKQFSTNAPIVNLHQKSSEVYVNISKTNFNFSAELEQGVLRIPKTMKDINSKVLDEKNKIRQIRATYGDGNQGIFDLTGYKGIIIFKEL
jgi:expansin (peptidoglycan-binding protein)